MQFDKSPSHSFRIGEPHSQGNLFDRFATVLQAQSRRFDSQALDCLGRRFTSLAAKRASELPRTQSRNLCESLDRKRLRQMFPGKIQGDADAIRLRFHLGHGGELGLASWSAIRHNQKPGDGARDFRTHVFFYHRQRQVYSRSDARRGPDSTVRDIDAVSLDSDARKARLQLSDIPPVGCRSPIVQQGRFRKQECTRAYACHPLGPVAQFPGSGHVFRRLHRTDITAHENDGVEGAPPERLCLDRKPGIAENQPARLRDYLQVVKGTASGCGRLVESRKRPGKIKSVVSMANEESDSMHDGVAGRMSWDV